MSVSSSNSTSNSSGQYSFESLPKFPANLFRFKEYNGAKGIAAVLLLTTLIYFLVNFWILLIGNLSLPPAQIRTFWDVLNGLLSSSVQLLDTVLDLFKFIIILTPLILSSLFAWIIFDPRNVATCALGFTNGLFGLLGILSPTDLIPDIIPFLGSVDDAFFSGGLIGIGILILSKGIMKDKETDAILALMNEHNEEQALQLLLKDKGVIVRKR